MDFFDQPPPHMPPPMQVYRQPPWLTPQENVLPTPVDLQLVAVRTDDVCVALRNFLAYTQEWSFELVAVTREPDVNGAGFGMFGPPPGFPGAPAMEEQLRYGFQFADGTKVTNMSFMAPPTAGFDPFAEPPGPVMMPGGGGSAGGRTMVMTHWCWPLPPAGEVTVVVEWKAQGVAATELTFDAARIRDAAAAATELWSDDHLPEPPGDWQQGVDVRIV
jgi:hypothetical protein